MKTRSAQSLHGPLYEHSFNDVTSPMTAVRSDTSPWQDDMAGTCQGWVLCNDWGHQEGHVEYCWIPRLQGVATSKALVRVTPSHWNHGIKLIKLHSLLEFFYKRWRGCSELPWGLFLNVRKAARSVTVPTGAAFLSVGKTCRMSEGGAKLFNRKQSEGKIRYW